MSRADQRDYLRRALRYQALDARLGAQTRFFGAAALICEALGQLSASPARFTVSADARRFLASISRELEPLNHRIATALAGRASAHDRLDARIVRIEQHFVQRRLDRLHHSSRHACERLVLHCNRLLNASPRGGADAAGRLGIVLCRLRHGGARRLDFSRQADREAIGVGLIEQLRAEPPPSAQS